jgi:hypothetical protein
VSKIISLMGVVLALLALFLGTGAAQQTPPGPTTAPSGEKEKTTAPLSLADFIPWAMGLGDRLTVLKTNIATLVDLSATGAKLQAISREVDGISGRLEKLKASERYEFHQLAQVKRALRLQGSSLAKVFDPLSAAINQMGTWEQAWREENARAKEFRTSLPKGAAVSTVRPVLDKAQKTIDTALSLIAQRLKPMLEAQRKAGELRASIFSLNTDVDGLIQSVRGNPSKSPTPQCFHPTTTISSGRSSGRNCVTVSAPSPGLKGSSSPGRDGPCFSSAWSLSSLRSAFTATARFSSRRSAGPFSPNILWPPGYS